MKKVGKVAHRCTLRALSLRWPRKCLYTQTWTFRKASPYSYCYHCTQEGAAAGGRGRELRGAEVPRAEVYYGGLNEWLAYYSVAGPFTAP